MGKAIIYECVSKCGMIIPQRNKAYLYAKWLNSFVFI